MNKSKINLQEILKVDLGHDWEFTSINNYGHSDYSSCKKCKMMVYCNYNYISVLRGKFELTEYIFESLEELMNYIPTVMLTCDEILIKRLLE